jgi:hypothetical protein
MGYFVTFILVVLMTTCSVVDGNTANTTLPDYEMAVGLCVNNDGVDHMGIKTQFNKVDYMELVVCNNGAEFKLKQYEEK